MAGARIKGVTVKARLDFAKAKGGDALLAKLKQAPGPAGELARTPLLAVRDFPIADVEALSEAIARELGGGPELFTQMGHHSADLNRMLQKMVHRSNTDPHELLRGILREFPMFITGEIGVQRYEADEQGGAGRVVWEGHGESGISHCLSTIGYGERVLQNWGVRGARGANLECLAKGDARCVWEFRWDSVSGQLRNTKQIRSDALAERIKNFSG